jgi:arsenate reductase
MIRVRLSKKEYLMNALCSLLLIISGLVVVIGVACTSQPRKTTAVAGTKSAAGNSAGKQRVIILCTGNSCRSQMAEAFWRKHGGDQWEIVSAGTKPSGRVDPLAIQVMAEKSIDISHQRSKSVEPFTGQTFDLVITVCSDAERACPVFPGGRKHIHHGFDDPPKAPGTHEDRLRVCRRVRDEIEAKVKEWIASESKH